MHEEPLLAPNFLFRFAAPLHHAAWNWSDKGLTPPLQKKHELPCFRKLEDRPPFGTVRMAWNMTGVAIHVAVTGKEQPIWRRGSRMGESDGVQIWLATRETQNIRRASRFCHRFVFLPPGPEKNEQHCFASAMPIARATAAPHDPPDGALLVAATSVRGGYQMNIVITADALTNYDPSEHPHLGFNYALIDRELGWQTLTLGPEFPIAEDPSLWCVLDLQPE